MAILIACNLLKFDMGLIIERVNFIDDVLQAGQSNFAKMFRDDSV
jgi:hypothetical protein